MFSNFLKEQLIYAKKIVKDLSRDYAYVSIFGRHACGRNVVLNNQVTTIGDATDITKSEAGFVIKVYHDAHYSEYSLDDLRLFKAEKFKEAMRLPGLKQDYVQVGILKDEPLVQDFSREEKEALTAEEILNELSSLRDSIKAYDPRIIAVRLATMTREISSFFVSLHRELTQYYIWNNAIEVILAKDEKNMQSMYRSAGAVNLKDAIRELHAQALNDAATAVKMLKAKAIKPGYYDVICDPAIAGLIAHEAFGHGVEMDMFVKNRAKAQAYVGKEVASPLVSMHDGAAATLSAASYFFDDDGVLAQDTLIIKDGILQDGLSDVLTALELGKEPSGNSRRESTRRKAYTRMTNTFFAAGKSEVADMIASIKHGYYLCNASNGMEDPKNWQIQCTAQYAIEIVDGKLTDNIVAPVVISGYVPDVLKSISMVSKEQKIFGSGMCGKGHKEWVYVADGGPYLKAQVKLG